MGKLERIKALKKDSSIQELLDEASRILKNPIAMFDTYYNLIAYTEVETDDPVWNELISTGTFSIETQEFFANENFVSFVTNANKIAVLKSDELKYDRVLALVFNRDGVKVANLVTVECETPLTTDDLIAFNAFADKVTASIRNQERFTEYGREYHNSLIGKVLDGEITDAKVYSAHIQILYDGFRSYLYLAVVDVGENGARSERLEQIRGLLKQQHRSYKFAIYSGYIVMIMSSKSSRFIPNQILGTHGDFFRQNDLYVGVSSSFESLYDLRKYYDEAVAALKNGIASGEDQRVFTSNKKR